MCICDRCGRVIAPNDHDEDQERLSIDLKAGYGSVFGDGNTVRADLCQHCVKKVLGPWLRITAESPGDTPHGAYQPYQLRARHPLGEAQRRFANEFRRHEFARPSAPRAASASMDDMERKLNYVLFAEEGAFVARCLAVEVTSDGDTEQAAVISLSQIAAVGTPAFRSGSSTSAQP